MSTAVALNVLDCFESPNVFVYWLQVQALVEIVRTRVMLFILRDTVYHFKNVEKIWTDLYLGFLNQDDVKKTYYFQQAMQ